MNNRQQTTITLDKRLHRRTKQYCAIYDTDVTKLINKLLSDFMKGKRVG